MEWRSERMHSTLLEHVSYGSSNKRKRSAITIVVDGESITSDPYFESWYDTVHIEVNDSVVQKVEKNRAKFLFIYHVMTQGPLNKLYTATRDERGAWGSKLRYTQDGELYYNAELMTVREAAPPATSSVASSSQSIRPSGAYPPQSMTPSATTVSNHSFTIVTYNCLYTEFADEGQKISSFELELIDKSREQESNPERHVLACNLGWNVRLPRLLTNIEKHGVPDILLLQETTPAMCRHIVSHFAAYYDDLDNHSRNGSLAGIVNNGYCYVLYNRHRFEKTRSVDRTSDPYQRIVGVALRDRMTGNQVFVVSVHLPASGSAPVAPIQDLLHEMTMPVIVGGDFNVKVNPFDGLRPLTNNKSTFYNDCRAKFDWIVGNGVRTLASHVNDVRPSEGRWPNASEGSDHTAVWVQLEWEPSMSVAGPSAFPSNNGSALGDDRITFRGHQFELVMPACKFTHKGMHNDVDPMYICRRCKILPQQAWPIPTLLVTARTWNQIGPRRERMTHRGAFGLSGDEYKTNAGVFGAHTMVLCWKFPGDMFHWGAWHSTRLRFPLPVGRYHMTDDKWGTVPVTNLADMPIGAPMIKMRMGGVHYLQSREGGDDTKVVMIGYQYFVNDMWEDDNQGMTATGQMLDRLYNDIGIVGFANHSQHHAIVMYAFNGLVLTPKRWQNLLQTDLFERIRAIFLSGTSDQSGIKRCLQIWRTVNLDESPFLA